MGERRKERQVGSGTSAAGGDAVVRRRVIFRGVLLMVEVVGAWPEGIIGTHGSIQCQGGRLRSIEAIVPTSRCFSVLFLASISRVSFSLCVMFFADFHREQMRSLADGYVVSGDCQATRVHNRPRASLNPEWVA